MRDCNPHIWGLLDPLELSLIPCSFYICKKTLFLLAEKQFQVKCWQKKCPKFPQNQGDKDSQLDQDFKVWKTKLIWIKPDTQKHLRVLFSQYMSGFFCCCFFFLYFCFWGLQLKGKFTPKQTWVHCNPANRAFVMFPDWFCWIRVFYLLVNFHFNCQNSQVKKKNKSANSKINNSHLNELQVKPFVSGEDSPHF